MTQAAKGAIIEGSPGDPPGVCMGNPQVPVSAVVGGDFGEASAAV